MSSILGDNTFVFIDNQLIHLPSRFINISYELNKIHEEYKTELLIDHVLNDSDNKMVFDNIKKMENIQSNIIFEVGKEAVENKLYSGVYVHSKIYKLVLNWIEIYDKLSNITI